MPPKEGQERLDDVAAGSNVVAHDHAHHRGDVERRTAAAAARESLVEIGVEHRRVGRRVERREPPVRDLRRERDVLRPDRGEVDRQIGAEGMHDRLERLAQAGTAGNGDVVDLAVELHRRVAPEDPPDDLHVLAGAL
jgi:hypothetical protein